MFAQHQSSSYSSVHLPLPAPVAGRRCRADGDTPREEGPKKQRVFQPALRLPSRIPLCASRSTTPQVRRVIGWNSNHGNGRRPAIQKVTGPAIEALTKREASTSSKSFEDRLVLGETYGQLQSDADQRAGELQALQQRTETLLRQLEKCKRDKQCLEKQVEALRSKNDDTAACVICLADQASHVLVPCGHLALCEGCCSLPVVECPICRRSCETKIRLYRP